MATANTEIAFLVSFPPYLTGIPRKSWSRGDSIYLKFRGMKANPPMLLEPFPGKSQAQSLPHQAAGKELGWGWGWRQACPAPPGGSPTFPAHGREGNHTQLPFHEEPLSLQAPGWRGAGSARWGQYDMAVNQTTLKKTGEEGSNGWRKF